MIVKNLTILGLLLLLGACGYSSKFFESHVVNIAPFSENVAFMVGELDYAFEKDRAIYTKWYFNKNSSKVKRLLNLEKLVNAELHFIVKYSNKIVFLSESNLTIKVKTTNLAHLIRTMYLKFANSKTLSLTNKKANEIIEDIKKQDDFLDALKKAQPFINEHARYANRLLDQLKKAETNLAYQIHDAIDRENAHLKTLTLSLRKHERELSNTIVLLNSYINTRSKKVLLSVGKMLNKQNISLLGNNKVMSTERIHKLKSIIHNRLKINTDTFNQLKPSYKKYIQAQEELIVLVDDHDIEIRKTRIIFITFSNAHRKMTSGLKKPAEWFDIKDLPLLLYSAIPL